MIRSIHQTRLEQDGSALITEPDTDQRLPIFKPTSVDNFDKFGAKKKAENHVRSKVLSEFENYCAKLTAE